MRLFKWGRGERWIGTLFKMVLISLGPVFVKMGQMISTRDDLLPSSVLAPLKSLQDRVPCMPPDAFRDAERTILAALTPAGVLAIDSRPLASGSIAQVHRLHATLQGRDLIVKIKRPGIDEMIEQDIDSLQKIAGRLQLLKVFTNVPVLSSVQLVCAALRQQADFFSEAAAHLRFATLLHSVVRVPQLIPELCRENFLIMQYMPDLRQISDNSLPCALQQRLVSDGLRALYRMIFSAGLIHCDMHPGNLYCGARGDLVLLDFGCWTQLPDLTRKQFAEFFMSVAINDHLNGCDIILTSAVRFPDTLDRGLFQADIQVLFQEFSGRKAADFLVSDFVARLFQVQRLHEITATPAFTLAILSLVTFEGVARPLFPDLDFQREAMPFLINAF